MPDNQSSVAADAAGNLYYVWYDSERRLPWLAISRDHGKSWDALEVVADVDVEVSGVVAADFSLECFGGVPQGGRRDRRPVPLPGAAPRKALAAPK